MQVAQIIAGYSLGQADLLRRAMGKKKKDVMAAEKEKFIAGAVQRGYTKEKANEIFDILVPFAGYGFNKSHAAAYSVIAYQTAWLKCHYPAEFMAANLTNDAAAGPEALPACMTEVRKMGITIDPPDVNRSDKYFSVVDGCIVYGFFGIKNVGSGAAEEIIKVRQSGYFKSFMDFLDRVDLKAVDKRAVEFLIKGGAFDKLDKRPPLEYRSELFHNLEKAMDYAASKKEDQSTGQASLFGGTDEKEYADFVFEKSLPWSKTEMLNFEKATIGFYFSGHPLDEYKGLWEKATENGSRINLADKESLPQGTAILVGLITNVKTINTKSGGKMAFVSLEDYSGSIDMTFFDSAWRYCADKITPDTVCIIKGKIEYQQSKDLWGFIADTVLSPDTADAAIDDVQAQARKWDKYRNIWKYPRSSEPPVLALETAENAKIGSYVVAGMLSKIRPYQTKTGKDMAFGSINDEKGSIDLTFFPRAWESCKDMLAIDEMVAFKGNLEAPQDNQNTDNKRKWRSFLVSSMLDINRLVKQAAKYAEAHPEEVQDMKDKKTEENLPPQDVKPVEKSVEKPHPEVHIRLQPAPEESVLVSLRDYLNRNNGDSPVFFHIKGTVVRAGCRIRDTGGEGLAYIKSCKAVAEAWVA
jgi:DNA polymerase-3 subunit alpha